MLIKAVKTDLVWPHKADEEDDGQTHTEDVHPP